VVISTAQSHALVLMVMTHPCDFVAHCKPIIIIIITIIKSTQGRVVNPLRDLVISLDLPVLQLRELINWAAAQVSSLILN
jgi:hypothetical protein